jgi:hypothetical protein
MLCNSLPNFTLKYTAFVTTALNLLLAGTAVLMRPRVAWLAHSLMGAVLVTGVTGAYEQGETKTTEQQVVRW